MGRAARSAVRLSFAPLSEFFQYVIRVRARVSSVYRAAKTATPNRRRPPTAAITLVEREASAVDS
jgi:hypothetical protein